MPFDSAPMGGGGGDHHPQWTFIASSTASLMMGMMLTGRGYKVREDFAIDPHTGHFLVLGNPGDPNPAIPAEEVLQVSSHVSVMLSALLGRPFEIDLRQVGDGRPSHLN